MSSIWLGSWLSLVRVLIILGPTPRSSSERAVRPDWVPPLDIAAVQNVSHMSSDSEVEPSNREPKIQPPGTRRKTEPAPKPRTPNLDGGVEIRNPKSEALDARPSAVILNLLNPNSQAYRGTSIIRNSAPLGPYSRKMPRALWRL
jgi:hypothetical protein